MKAHEFRQDVYVQTPVDESLAQVFSELLNANQTAMSQIAFEHTKMQARIQQLEKENASLKAENQKLREDVHVSQAASGVHGTGRQMPALEETEGAFVLERNIEIHDAPVHSVCMAPNQSAQKVVATASWDATVKLYDLASSEVVRTLGDVEQHEEGKMGGLYAVAFAKTAPEVLGCTSCDKSVYLWNHQTGTLLSKLDGHRDEVNGIDFHSEQQVMCTASDDCKVIIWDFQEGITLRTLDKHTKAVYGCTFLGLENQYFVATCCFDQKTRIFDMRDKKIVQQFQGHTDDVIGIDYSCPNQLLATGSDDGCISIWDARTWKKQQTINTREDDGISDNEVKRIAFSPDGTLLAAACSSGRVLVYDITKFPSTQVAQLSGHTDCVFDVTWGQAANSNAKILVSASHDHHCRYWREVV